MHQIKEMLKKMGFEIVADEMKTVDWKENDGSFVAQNKNRERSREKNKDRGQSL